MAGLLNAARTIMRLASNIDEKGIAKGLLDTVESKDAELARADGSMLRLMGKYMVEPVAVVSDDLKDVEELDNILGLHMDLFTSYYMQVFDILRNQYGISINVAVDTLATDNGGIMRVLLKGANVGIELSNESDSIEDYLGQLLTVEATTKDVTDAYDRGRGDGAQDYQNDTLRNDALKAGSAANAYHVNKGIIDSADSSRAHSKALHDASASRDARKADRDALKKVPASERLHYTGKDTVREATKLGDAYKDLLIPNAIQRTIEIKVETAMNEPGNDGKFHTKSFTIPVTIKLAVIFTSKENIINAISTQSAEYSFSSRLDEYRAGAISLADFVLATDLVTKYKKHRLKDKDMLGTLMKARELSSDSKIIVNGFAGFEKYYNMYLISPDTKVAIEREVRAKIKSNGKDRFLKAANGLSVTVVDPDYERISIMLKDIHGKTDLTFKKAIKKDKNDSDYGELVKALMANKPPAF